ncbi:glycosyltransferase WbuB [Thermococcus sp. M39]|uniref:glycosyltransferase family 4 protein n=1 Tax=unclassified Thermococcus TaxID=2627626 RepID=UPI00143A8A28|nr:MULTISPECIES: glycosyltransferase family 4 protein [unclassified Thermococcus]NJE08444.1 glycosyltransferase WbuB [Thermococcus sp. M39]NJE11947.1 glycosyltransferase WbuB [Thermococcus sp. LS2]
MDVKADLIIFSQAFPPEKGGNASRIGDLYKYLTKFGIKVIVVSALETYPFGTFPREFRLIKKDGDVIRLFTYQPKKDASSIERVLYYTIFPVLASIWLIFNRKSSDVILITSPPPQMYLVALIGKLLRKKVIIDIRDLFLDVSVNLGFIKKGSLVERAFRFLESKALQKADAVTLVTLKIRRQLVEEYGIDSAKCYVVPNGVDLETFKCDKLKRKLQMVYAGYFGHAQDFDTFLKGYALLKENERVPLILAGGGETLEDVLKNAEKLGIAKWINYVGMLSRREVVKLLCSSSIGVAPIKVDESLKYAIPSKIYEYLACGLPFIGVGIGEIERIAEESRAGCVGKTPEEVAECIRKLLNSNLEKLRVQALRYVKRFSRESSAEKFLNVLNSLRGQK